MRFDQPLIEGTLLRRYKRFLADVKLNNGSEITAHCANPGSMIGCSDPGSKVLLSVDENPRRKFKHQLEIIYSGRTPIGIHSGRPSSVIAEAISKAKIPEVAGYATMRSDVRFGRDSRIDLLVEGNGLRSCYIKVENVTLAREGTGLFPDAVNERGTTQMEELTDIVREGNRAMVVFVAQRSDVSVVRLADEIDAEFGQAMRDAAARGVETIAYRAKVTRKGIELDIPVEVDLSE